MQQSVAVSADITCTCNALRHRRTVDTIKVGAPVSGWVHSPGTASGSALICAWSVVLDRMKVQGRVLGRLTDARLTKWAKA
jgi:hypothetical protein